MRRARIRARRRRARVPDRSRMTPVPHHRKRRRGQSLAEFAIVFPVFIAIVGGIIQFGLVFWAQNTLTQVVRDVGRWEATQQASPCSSNTTALASAANTIAKNAS